MSQHESQTFDPTENRGADLEKIFDAVHSSHLGDDRPAYAQEGLIWAKDVGWAKLLNYFDGTVDIPIGYFNSTTGKLSLHSSAREVFKSAAYLDVGTAAGNVVQLDNNARLPALDARNLSNVPAPVTGTSVVGVPEVNQGSGGQESGGVVLGDGSIAIWGKSEYGQLGTGSSYSSNRSQPVEPAFPVDYTGIPKKWVRSRHDNYLLTESGEVWTWGRNAAGSLGHGHTANVHVPTKIAALDGVNIVDVSVGFHTSSADSHALFLADDGTLYACGDNGSGQLGLGDTTNRATPVALAKTDWSKIWAVGSHAGSSYAVDAAGDLYCWGYNGVGALGLGDTTNRNTPSQNNLLGGEAIVGFAADQGDHPNAGAQYYGHCAALTVTGKVFTWGYNGSSCLGVGDNSTRDTPQEIIALGTDNKAVYVGGGGAYGFTVVQKDDDTLWGAGRNTEGQLGLGSTATYSLFTEIPNSKRDGIGSKQVMVVGAYNYCGLAVLYDDGEIRVTGYNADGRLGLGHRLEVDALEPMLLPRRLGAIKMCSVGYSSVAGIGVMTAGGSYYQVGAATNSMLPSDAGEAEGCAVPYLVRF